MRWSNIFLIAALIFLPFIASAQFYVTPGSTFYVKSGTELQIDSLVLIPSTPLTLNGVTISKSYTPISGTGGSSISRVYQFSEAITLTGITGMYVDDTELNSNIFSALQIAYDPGTGFITTSTSTVNNITNLVSNDFHSPVSISQLTATNTGIVLPVKLQDADGAPVIFTVYPNPATDNVFAELSGNVAPDASIMLVDISGRILMKIPANQKKISFNIAHLPSGMYFATYVDEKHQFSFKLHKK